MSYSTLENLDELRQLYDVHYLCLNDRSFHFLGPYRTKDEAYAAFHDLARNMDCVIAEVVSMTRGEGCFLFETKVIAQGERTVSSENVTGGKPFERPVAYNDWRFARGDGLVVRTRGRDAIDKLSGCERSPLSLDRFQ